MVEFSSDFNTYFSALIPLQTPPNYCSNFTVIGYCNVTETRINIKNRILHGGVDTVSFQLHGK